MHKLYEKKTEVIYKEKILDKWILCNAFIDFASKCQCRHCSGDTFLPTKFNDWLLMVEYISNQIRSDYKRNFSILMNYICIYYMEEDNVQE